jgi:transposase-like protein
LFSRRRGMEKNQSRRMSAEEKVVVEGRGSGATISEVCRRHQIVHTHFYRWERIAREGALEALRNGSRRAKNGKREESLTRGEPLAHGHSGARCRKPDP